MLTWEPVKPSVAVATEAFHPNRTPHLTELAVLEDYQQGIAVDVIAAKHGICDDTIGNIRRRHGVASRPRWSHDGHLQAVETLVGEGLSYEKIAATLNISDAAVRRMVRQHGISRTDLERQCRLCGARFEVRTQRTKHSYCCRSHARRGAHLQATYGLRPERLRDILGERGHTCANPGCETGVSLDARAIDHCHQTGRVRGILCFGCNTALGLAHEDACRLRGLAAYIEAQAS